VAGVGFSNGGAELLDCDLAGHRAERQRLLGDGLVVDDHRLDEARLLVRREALHDPLRREDDRKEH